jgi:hypothetical protein
MLRAPLAGLLAIAAAAALGCDSTDRSTTGPQGTALTSRGWHSQGAPVGGVVTLLRQHTDGTILAVVDDTAIARKPTGSCTWALIDLRAQVGHLAEVKDLADATDGGIIAATTSGLLRSTDHGISWSGTGENVQHAYAVAASATGTLLAGTSSQGIFRSTNVGETWAVTNAPTSGIVLSIAWAGGTTWYAGTLTNALRSTDDGISWTPVIDQPVANLIFVSRSGRVFVGSHGGGLHYTDDAGAHWSDLVDAFTPFPLPFPSSMSQGENGQLFTAMAGDVFVSTNDGSSWTKTPLPESDAINSILEVRGSGSPSPQFSTVLYLGANDGVWRSDDEAVTRTLVGIRPLEITALGMNAGGTVMVGARAGALSGGLYTRDEAGAWLPTAFGGSWLWAFATDLTGRTYVARTDLYESGSGYVATTVDGGQSWNLTAPMPDDDPLWLDLGAGDRVCVALRAERGEMVRCTTNGGTSWENTGSGLPDGEDSQARQVVSDADGTLYARVLRYADNAQLLFRHSVGGSAWTPITSPVTGDNVVSILAGASGALYASTTSHGLYKSSDRGASWHAVSTLASQHPTELAIDGHGVIYVGTEHGLHGSGDAGATWQVVDQSLASASITRVRMSQTTLLVSTAQGEVFAGGEIVTARAR